MSSISKAGIFIDVKDLLRFTFRTVGCFEKTDEGGRIGKQLVDYNLEMIAYFVMAYHRRDEHIIFDAGDKTYDINLKGEKRVYVDALEAAFDKYQALMEYAFDNLAFPKVSARKRRRKHKHFMELMANIGSGIDKWSRSVYKQITVAEKGRGKC